MILVQNNVIRGILYIGEGPAQVWRSPQDFLSQCYAMLATLRALDTGEAKSPGGKDRCFMLFRLLCILPACVRGLRMHFGQINWWPTCNVDRITEPEIGDVSSAWHSIWMILNVYIYIYMAISCPYYIYIILCFFLFGQPASYDDYDALSRPRRDASGGCLLCAPGDCLWGDWPH